MHVEIIAEVGECFNGDMQIAHIMIHEAKKAGCDVVKFQILDIDEVAKDDPEYDWFAKIELGPQQIKQLIKWTEEEEIDILFTPVSVKTAKWLLEAGQKQVKIASSFVGKTELIEYINNNFEKVYASTGMADLNEISDMINALNKVRDITLLHCISEYPTGPLLDERGLRALDEKDAHLNMMLMLKGIFRNVRIGYSDHTDDVFVPLVASSMGAEVIEKHFTLDRKTPIEHFERKLEYMGTDHVLSIEPDALKTMVDNIRRMELIIGDWRWDRSDGEKVLMKFLKNRYKER